VDKGVRDVGNGVENGDCDLRGLRDIPVRVVVTKELPDNKLELGNDSFEIPDNAVLIPDKCRLDGLSRQLRSVDIRTTESEEIPLVAAFTGKQLT
jgi:hypothetical protein